ncbi:MAG: extracellular solute-binding protein [Deltaproteobacteria bacterium]|nr:extracellular solute-binding protein [Deltaproteobacteria bacterium]
MIWFVVLLGAVFSVWGASAPKGPLSRTEAVLSQLMESQGNERIKRLVEGARKEGLLVFYSPDREELTNIRIELFKELYPGVIQKFETPRIRSDVMIDRLLTEERAGKHQADLVWLRLPQVPVMSREGLLAKYISFEDSVLPAELKIGGVWRSLGNRLFHIMYNTKLVSEKDAPKSWEDLLDPKWKGKLILDDTSYDWFVGMLDYMGQEKGLEFMKKLASNGLQIQQRRSNVENMVAAGEVPIMVANSGTSAAERIARGEPLAFVRDPRPPIAYGEGLAIMRNAPHPHAAALFVEAVLSERWQRGAAEKIKIRPARPGLPDPVIDAKIKPHFISPMKWPAERYEWAQREYVRILVRKNF